MATQQEIAARIITQLKTADPSISAIVGTPERKIIDSVAEVLAQAQIDINMLNGAFDVDAKYGSDLDNMLGLFGFGRQQAVKASGYVEFSRKNTSAIAIPIPAGTQLKAMGAANGADVAFITTRSVTLSSNTTVVLAPVECIISGSVGNVAANSIKDWNGAAISGIDSLTNPSITYGGVDSENDDQVKARFKIAGPFRNLAGTKDQYLSLALGTKSTKANVVGPVSQYTEYVQVPLSPDNSGGNGSKGTEYTTALSTNLNSKHFYENLAKFIADDTVAISVVFNENFDFVINNDSNIKNKGDSYRNYLKGSDVKPTGATYRPNVTFTNVYTGTGNTNQTISSGDVLLFEHYYMSSASRNDYNRGVLNCVDVFVNGSDETLATATIPRPGNGIPAKIFTDVDQYDSLYYGNFRRFGSPTERPIPGNIFVPLPHQPVLDVPDTIVVAAGTFRKNVHYWAVEEITDLRGTVRARNGLELSVQTKAQSSQDPDAGPYTGPKITDYSGLQTSLVLSINDTGSGFPYIIVDSTTAGGLFSTGTLVVDDEQINYEKTITSTWSNAATYTSGTLTNAITADATSISVTTTTAPLNGTNYLLVDNEIISYTGFTGIASPWTITGVSRGLYGTIASTHASGAAIGSYAIYKDSSDLNSYLYRCISPVTTAGTTPKDDVSKWAIVGLSLTTIANGRGANGTTASTHQSGALVGTPFASTDNLLSIENYVYDANIYNLQNSLESNKQITTDVLAHKAKVRYFKPDVSIMYSKGSNPSGVNQSIISALNNYFDNQYFGSTIQLSDVLQTIHNVPGVDNVRWSKDALTSKNLLVDSDYDPRNKLSEVDPYGTSPKVVLQQVRATDGSNKTQYKLYLSTNVSTITSIQVDRPTSNYTTTEVRLSTTSGLKPKTTYSITSPTLVGTDKIRSFTTGSLVYGSDTNLAIDGKYKITLNEASLNSSSGATTYQASITELIQGKLTFKYGDVEYSMKLDTTLNGGQNLTTTNLQTQFASFATVSASLTNNFPTVDNPYTITYINGNDTNLLTVVDSGYLSDSSWVYNDDFLLGDNELAALPIGTTDSNNNVDPSSIITVRAKAQNTWDQI